MKLAAKLDDLIAKNLYPVTLSANDYHGTNEGSGSKHGRLGTLSTKNGLPTVDKHIDVHEDEGYITIPCEELPDDWSEKSDMLPFKSLDRPFVFPGEQVHIIACLSGSKQEEYGKQREELLIRFKHSHFFARIAESDEVLWSRRKTDDKIFGGKFIPIESSKDDVSVKRGILDASTSGGVAKNDVKCSLLANGDIVVLLQVNIGVDFLTNPVLEILQFEKYQTEENLGYSKQDPYGDLLKWLLPVQNSFSPPEMSPNPSTRTSLTRQNSTSSFGSQNFLSGQFKSQPKSAPSTPTPPKNSGKSGKSGTGSDKTVEGLLSFRGVPLEPERFSVRCGLEGIYIPGRKWRRKIQIIQPLEIHCFAADCNTQDLLCVQIKNVSPAQAPDIVIYLDAITVIFEETYKGGRGPPFSLPIACIEAGNDHGLPNLPLRKDEEHSFILKPATPLWSCNSQGEKNGVHIFKNVDRGNNKYAVLVSCRCNYTESRLLFKQPTNWRPHIQKDILISVSSRMTTKTVGPDDRIPKLPVQVLTLEASNLTNEDLTLTLLAPSSLTPSSVVSLTCSPPSPVSLVFDDDDDDNRPTAALNRLHSASMVLDQTSGYDLDRTSASFNQKTIPISNVSDLGRTHMWMKTKVPLGCVPSRSTVTAKLELLPLTDGIITLDSLQINAEKAGLTYVPEHPLNINSTSSIHIGSV